MGLEQRAVLFHRVFPSGDGSIKQPQTWIGTGITVLINAVLCWESAKGRGKLSFIPALCANPEVFSKPRDRHSHLASSRKCSDLRGHPGLAPGRVPCLIVGLLGYRCYCGDFGLPSVERAS